MSDEPASTNTSETSRSDDEPPRPTQEWFLIRALECDAPTEGSARHSLRDVASVEIVRGTAHASVRQRADSGQTLVISLPDRKVSATHARLTRTRSGWLLEDLESTNGSFVGTERVQRKHVGDGAVLTLGRTLFLLRHASIENRPQIDVSFAPSAAPSLSTLSPTLEDSFTRAARVAVSGLPILLLGESGTGKEIHARAIHERSKRPGPFVPVNCGAIPENLVEAHLFGHIKGAFTGAAKAELGYVRSAAFGTLFLDEIGDLPPASQAALLRVLQSGEVTPVGSAQAIHVDVRIVAATHKDIDSLMEAGTFRRDLYARLEGFVNHLPPLRERREDLGLMIGTLLTRHAARDRDAIRFRPEAAHALFAYDWPLNVRELEQCLASALVLADDGRIDLTHLPNKVRNPRLPPEADEARPRRLSEEERALRDTLVAALTKAKGNVTQAAQDMGKARQQVQRWMRRFGLDADEYR